MRSPLLALFLVAACATQPSQPPIAHEASTPGGQRTLETMMSFFVGNWDPLPDQPATRLRVLEFWKGTAVRWVYLEWVRVADDSKPTRQFVARITEDSAAKMKANVYRLVDPARFAGEWKKEEPFRTLSLADLREVPACAMIGQRPMIAHFVLVTEGNQCPGDMPGVPNMRLEFSITTSELDLLEQPRDAAGNLPPGLLDPFRFNRTSKVPK
jgi:hypothetical protein